MKTGTLKVRLYTDGAQSLKDKRSVIRSLKDRIRDRFNASVAEVDDQDLWQCATLGIAVVGTDETFVGKVLDKITDFLRNNPRAALIDIERDVF